MLRLSEAQKRTLRTMADFDCAIRTYEGMQLDNRGRAWFNGERVRHATKRFVSISTVRALARRELIADPNSSWHLRRVRHYFVLTPKGRELAKELEEQDARQD